MTRHAEPRVDAHPPSGLLVRLNMDQAPRGMELLSPGGAMRWGDCRLVLNPAPGGSADFSVVLANARPHDRFHCAAANTLFIAGEPAEKKIYPKPFYRQFGHVLDTHGHSGHPGLICNAPGLNWHVGLDLSSRSYRYGYDFLAGLERPEKANRIAVICSASAHTAGQRQRLALLDALKAALGERLVHFGKGFRPIDDKLEAIAPYRFHLVLENTRAEDYWTEKLADAFLGWAFPIYWGCPNIERYFPPGALQRLPEDTGAAVGLLERLLAGRFTPAEGDAVAGARRLVLERYNPLAWSAHWARTLYRPLVPTVLTLRSHKAFRPFPRGRLFRLRHGLPGRRRGTQRA